MHIHRFFGEIYNMLILIMYDVGNVKTKEGQSRLRKMEKMCIAVGHRIQNSVYECHLTTEELMKIKKALLEVIDIDADTLRFYNLGNKWQQKVEHYGVIESYDPHEVLSI